MKDDFLLHTFNQMIIYCALNLSLTFNQHGALSASKNIYHCGKISYFFQTFQHVFSFLLLCLLLEISMLTRIFIVNIW